MHSVVLVSTALIVFSILVSSTVMAMSNKYISPEKTQVNSKKYVVSLDKNTVVRVTQLKQINTSLPKCPFFVEMESQWSPVYRSMRPILEKLIAEYRGKATIAYIDVD
jgi:thioredoxin-like negative regulator of GroEL